MLIEYPQYRIKNSCGYCHKLNKDSLDSCLYSFVVAELTLQNYQDLIDRGFRRSGTYLYKPDLRNGCCPQYTIRLDVQRFRPSGEHRQTLNRFNRFLRDEYESGATKKHKGKDNKSFDLLKVLNDPLEDESIPFRVQLETASYSQEKFELYKRYQLAVHNDDENHVNPDSFENFLCQNPFTDYTENENGAMHQLYYYKNELIGIGIIDVLPKCVSSVYFIWDPKYAKLGLGKLSTLREIGLALDTFKLPYYYMGYYIHDNHKVDYKSHYSPSYFLDPWFTKLNNNNHNQEECWWFPAEELHF